jgi:hypothetical protein
MKSIIQEASTIAKAIEQSWQRAGEPKEFSVKILELPERNFIGMTTRSAKIAFMFNGVSVKQVQEQPVTRPVSARQTVGPVGREQRKENVRLQRDFVPKREHVEREIIEQEKPAHQAPARQMREEGFEKRRPESLWNKEIVDFARTWFEAVLKHMGSSDITFTIEPQNYYLRITLNRPVLDQEGQEKHLLASLSLLMFSTIKKEFRKALRGHKVVLTHAQQ